MFSNESNILKDMLVRSIAQIADSIGFDKVSSTSLEILTDIFYEFMKSFAVNLSNIRHESFPLTINDGLFVLEIMGISLESILEFLDVSSCLPPPITYFLTPHVGIVQLNVPNIDDEELKTRPSYIPKHLPLLRTIHALPKEAEYVKKDRFKTLQPALVSQKDKESSRRTKRLPPWIEKNNYRMARVSIDPISKELIEHGYIGRIADASPDFAMIKRYRRVAPISKPSRQTPSPIRTNLDFEPIINDGESISIDSKPAAQKVITDAEWEAILKTDAPNTHSTIIQPVIDIPKVIPIPPKPKPVRLPPAPPPPGFMYKKVRKGSRWIKKLVKIPEKKKIPKTIQIAPIEITNATLDSKKLDQFNESINSNKVFNIIKENIDEKIELNEKTCEEKLSVKEIQNSWSGENFLPPTPINSGSPISQIPRKNSLLDNTPSPIKNTLDLKQSVTKSPLIHRGLNNNSKFSLTSKTRSLKSPSNITPAASMTSAIVISNKIKKRLTKLQTIKPLRSNKKRRNKEYSKNKRIKKNKTKKPLINSSISDAETDPMIDEIKANEMLIPLNTLPLTLKISASDWRRPIEDQKDLPSEEEEEDNLSYSSSISSQGIIRPALTCDENLKVRTVSDSSHYSTSTCSSSGTSLSSQTEKHSMRNRPTGNITNAISEMPTLTYTKPSTPPILIRDEQLNQKTELVEDSNELLIKSRNIQLLKEPKIEQEVKNSSGIKIKIKLGASTNPPPKPESELKMPKLVIKIGPNSSSNKASTRLLSDEVLPPTLELLHPQTREVIPAPPSLVSTILPIDLKMSQIENNKKSKKKKYTEEKKPVVARARVDSVFSEDEEDMNSFAQKPKSSSDESCEEGQGEYLHLPATAKLVLPRETLNQNTSSSTIKRRNTAIPLTNGGGSFYYNIEGEKVWLCPVCSKEDDGVLMIGCDKCDDWYHGRCLGFTEEPSENRWFCPKCSGQELPLSIAFNRQQIKKSSLPTFSLNISTGNSASKKKKK